MKTNKLSSSVLWVICMALPFNLLAQVNEIPITTSSSEALKFFKEGRDKSEDFKNAEAASLFDKAIQKDPNFAMAYLYRAQSGGGNTIYMQNLEKAIGLADKVSEGERLEIQYFKASGEGNGEKQKELLGQLLKSFPSDKRVQDLAGIYYFSINDFQAALSYFNKSAEIDPKYASAYNMIGYCQSALNNYPESEKAFKTYISLTPNSPNGYDSYGELLLKMGKYDESIVQYKKAIQYDPAFASSLAGIGNNYIFKGDYETARKNYQDYYDKSALINGKFDALLLKAVSYIYEEKPAQAIAVIEDYRDLAEKKNLTTNAIQAYNLEGFILSETGNPAEGIEHFRKAEELLGTSKLSETTRENLNTYSMLWKFYALTANAEYDKAKIESENCSQKVDSRKNPGEEMWLNSLYSFNEFKKGDYDQAIQYYSKADQEDPMNWYYLGVAYSKKGDKQKASELFGKVTKYNVNSLSLALVRKRASQELNAISVR